MTRFLCVALLLAVAVAPATCVRPLSEYLTLAQEYIGRNEPAAAFEAEAKPWFCHDLDCPTFKVLNKTDGYETRLYKEGKWASTRVSGLLYSPSVTAGFKRLFDYISGENEDSTKIPMTAPVTTRIEPGQGPFCKSNFTVSFFVPFEFQESTPEPSKADVFLQTNPEITIFVSQFGGYLVDDVTLSVKAKALKEKLLANNESFIEGFYGTSSYDPPFRVTGRHNEVWFVKK